LDFVDFHERSIEPHFSEEISSFLVSCVSKS
jgi:hypothetical protein